MTLPTNPLADPHPHFPHFEYEGGAAVIGMPSFFDGRLDERVGGYLFLVYRGQRYRLYVERRPVDGKFALTESGQAISCVTGFPLPSATFNLLFLDFSATLDAVSGTWEEIQAVAGCYLKGVCDAIERGLVEPPPRDGAPPTASTRGEAMEFGG